MTENPFNSMTKPASGDWSYERHRLHEQEIADSEHLPSCYTDPETVDNWRHLRMRAGLKPLLEHSPNASWLTIGDGNYGSDAYFLNQNGAKAVASSLTDSTLVVAANKGYLTNFRAENAESLSQEDKSVEYTLCKEAYHHFPRPAVAFYEMVRISSKAVVLIEPAEGNGRILNRFKRWMKTKLRGDTEFDFEVSGNYIFRLSVREMEKMMIAMNSKTIAYRYFNDYYNESYGGDAISPESRGLRLTKLGIWIQDILCRLHLMDWGLVTFISFNGILEDSLRQKLKTEGYQVKNLPVNPYL